jgi:hypothetical protein
MHADISDKIAGLVDGFEAFEGDVLTFRISRGVNGERC